MTEPVPEIQTASTVQTTTVCFEIATDTLRRAQEQADIGDGPTAESLRAMPERRGQSGAYLRNRALAAALEVVLPEPIKVGDRVRWTRSDVKGTWEVRHIHNGLTVWIGRSPAANNDFGIIVSISELSHCEAKS